MTPLLTPADVAAELRRRVADLKTTAEERARVRAVSDGLGVRILDDFDTLLAENARLRAVAEAARAAVVDEENERDALRRALYALEAP